MAFLDPEEAATLAHGRWVEGKPASPLREFAIDSRVIEPYQTFIALETDRRDGHDFLQQAYDHSALAAVVKRPNHGVPLPQLVVEDPLSSLQSLARIWRQRFPATVIGISGSYGKTTVKEMLGTALGSHWFRTRGNLNNLLGVPLSLLEMDPKAHAGAIIEAGINRTGEMERLAEWIDPDHVIITAVGPAHLEGLGGVDGVAREKARLAEAVRPGGVIIVPAALLRHKPFRKLAESREVHAVSLEPAETAELRGLKGVTIFNYNWIESGDSPGMGRLESRGPMPRGRFRFPAGSPGMVSNLALVVHAGLHLGVPESTLAACLESWRPFRHRGEILRLGGVTYYVDCYNANPGSMVDSVRRFATLYRDRPRILVLGSMDELGEASADWHRRTAAGLRPGGNTEVFLTGHGAASMKAGLLESGFPEERIRVVASLDPVRERIGNFEGAVFLKGSRSQGLEQLVPEGTERC